MVNREPFEIGEWYHCYTRGVDKRKTFLSVGDYRRFIQTLYIANSADVIHRSDLWYLPHHEFFALQRGEPLVAIGAYCVMPNHFHLVMQEIVEGGITRFMRKVGISYAMYFNVKNDRVGNLFVRPFRSKHIDSDQYLSRVAQYVHLNPVELFESGWKDGVVKNKKTLETRLRAYEYSSLPDYQELRNETVLLDREATLTIQESLPPLSDVIDEAVAYYQELSPKIVKMTS